jgi:hypothetical protein
MVQQALPCLLFAQASTSDRCAGSAQQMEAQGPPPAEVQLPALVAAPRRAQHAMA